MTDSPAHRSERRDIFQVSTLEAGVEVALLGPTTVTRHGMKVELSGPKRRALLVLLALNCGVPVSRERIIDALWPRERTGREDSTLRVHVSHLRDVLEPERGHSPNVLVTLDAGYMLSPEHVTVDIARFEMLRQEAHLALGDNPERALDLLTEALGLWRGRAMQDVEYDEFAQDEIRRLDLVRTEVIEDRAEALIGLGEEALAIQDLESQVRRDPTRERPVRLLMRAFYRSGRQTEALSVASRHRRSLGDLGLEPSPLVVELEGRILSHDPTLYPAGTIAPADIKPGRAIRGYELREIAGRGAIGVVFRAFQPSVGREVAIKVIDRGVANESEFIRLFAEEATLVAGLEHPHIVPIYDFWRDPLGAFVVMRWMEGGSLTDRLEKAWRAGEIGRVFGQLADALEFAHSAGVVHRDVKPANILFDGIGNAYLGDFGLAATAVDRAHGRSARTAQPPYAAPEALRGEVPSVAADVFSLGMVLTQVALGSGLHDQPAGLVDAIGEVVEVATAPNPTERFPDMAAFRTALNEAIGDAAVPAPRKVRRNPYKGLAPFDEADHVDFYGREDLTDSLIDLVRGHSLVAIIGASGSGKSSLVLAGLIPELRRGAVPGSEDWAVVTMKPGVDPFEEFLIGLRPVVLGESRTGPRGHTLSLRDAFDAALSGPRDRGMLVVDQLEELFSSAVDASVRRRFIDELVDLASDPVRRIRVVVTLRADFADRPLSHPHLGDLMARASLLVAPMPPEQLEDVIRRPAARVGVQIEPGLVAEIARDVSTASAYLPLLQYVMTELFERRTEDRLTVSSYRALGGVRGVLERRADATYAALRAPAQQASRQLFLRMVQLGDRGEETRRRLPLDELRGLARPDAVDTAREAFASVRLLTYDRDPVSRTPTVEVAHEAVISQWTRYRIWIEEARSDLAVQRRLSSAAAAWEAADEDPAYLLTGGPLAAALDVAAASRIQLNEFESRFLEESRMAEETARAAEEARRHQEQQLERTARRRLRVGVVAAAVSVLVGALAVFASFERQRANDLAAVQSRQNLAREVAAASLVNLTAGDHDLSLLLAIAGAEQSLEADEPILPEVVDALHRAIINPRPSLIIDGAATQSSGQALEFANDGTALAVLTPDGGAAAFDSWSGERRWQTGAIDPPAFGLDIHPSNERVLTIHADAVREWAWRDGSLRLDQARGGGEVAISTAAYSHDGGFLAVGYVDGSIRVLDLSSGETVELSGHVGRVTSVDFDPTGTRLVSGGVDREVLVWDIPSGDSVRARTEGVVLPIVEVAWHPRRDLAAVTTAQGEMFLFDTERGDRLNSFGNGQSHSREISFDASGTFAVAAGNDGYARVFGVFVGGEAAFQLPTGGVRLQDAVFDHSEFIGQTVATVGFDGRVRIWRDFTHSELPAIVRPYLYPSLAATPDGSRYVSVAHGVWTNFPLERATVEVIDSASGESLLSRPTARDIDLDRTPAITDDGSHVAFAGPEGDIEIVEVATGTTVALADSALWTVSLSFNSAGTVLAGGGVDGTVSLWDVARGDLVGTLSDRASPNPVTGVIDPFGPSRVSDLMFRPGAEELAFVRLDGSVHVWNTESGEHRPLHTFAFFGRSLEYSADGLMLAGSDGSGTVLVWSTDTWSIIARPEPVAGETRLAFSPDGRLLAGGGPSAVTHLWDLESERIVRRIVGSIYPPAGLAFVNGGDELRVSAGEGIDRGYVLDPGRLVELARAKVGRQFTEAECQRYLDRACGG